MLSRDSDDEMWSRFVFELVIWPQKLLCQDELNPRVRCAFGNVFYHESFSSAFTPTNMQFIAMPRRFHFRWANYHLLSVFSNFIALIQPRLSISSEGWQKCQREIRMCIAQAQWSLSNVHNVHNLHFVFWMCPLIYQYVIINMYCLVFFGN